MAISSKATTAKNVDEYIKRYPANIQPVLQKIRQTIRNTAPAAEEVISYQIPGYKQNGMLIFFAAFKDHISVYPAPRQNKAFKKELSVYKGGKGTVQFPIDQPIPYDLITRMTQFRLRENEQRAVTRKKPIKKVKSKTKSNKS